MLNSYFHIREQVYSFSEPESVCKFNYLEPFLGQKINEEKIKFSGWYILVFSLEQEP